MKKYLLVVLIIFSISIPIQSSRGISHAEIDTVPQSGQQNPTIPRVYGTDLSQDIFTAITYDNYQEFVRNFTEIGVRHILDATDMVSGNNLEARNYLIDQMEALSNGRMEVQVIGKHLNVVGKLAGYLPGNNPAFAIVGHYDSWFSSLGANEGGAGIATMLALIEPFSLYSWPLDIYFVASNARYVEWGPFGPAEVANWFYNQSVEFYMVYTVEALLLQDLSVPQDERLNMIYMELGQDNYHIGQYWANLAESMSKNIGASVIKSVSSDDCPYWNNRYIEQTYYQERGYFQSIIAIESGFINDETIRSPFDTWNNDLFKYYLGKEMTAAIGASIAFTMSRKYGQPIQYDLSFNLEVGKSRSFYIPISTPTSINVSSRWFGGTASFALYSPSGSDLAYVSYDRTSAWQTTDVFTIPVTQKGLYRLRVDNTDSHNVGYEFHYSYDGDIDGNGIFDSQEYWLDETLFEKDSDSDMLSDAYEIILGTDMDNSDSDFDMMPDGYEIAYGFDPTNSNDALEDADGDSLTNIQEYILGLNPLSEDTDSDLLPDAWELEYGLNPLRNDASEDPDGDEKTNLDEFLNGTNPLVAERETASIPMMLILIPTIVALAGISFYAWTEYKERTWSEY